MMSDEAVALLGRDPALGPLVADHGPIVLEPAPDPFARLVQSVARQQISMAAGDAVVDRLDERIGLDPVAIAETDQSELESVGLSAQKAETIQTIAQAQVEGTLEHAQLAELPDATVIDRLTAIDGVGPWTAKMYLIFCLARPDVFPVEDLGVRRAMETVVGVDGSRQAMVERAGEWSPVRTYATLYLWRAVD